MSEPRDRELNVRAVVWFGIGLAALILVAATAMWWFLGLLEALEVAGDPPPPAMAEALEVRERPAPLLQNDPEMDLQTFRRHESRILGSYGWVDQGAGLARVPIERAIDLFVEESTP